MAAPTLARCFRCGNVWKPRRAVPRMCSVCKSILWNVPVIRPFPTFDRENKSWANIVSKNRSTILEATKRHKAHNPRVFGSVRRGTAGPTSDLDLLVTFEPRATLLDRIALKQELEAALHLNVDVVNDRAIFWLIRSQVLAEAEPV